MASLGAKQQFSLNNEAGDNAVRTRSREGSIERKVVGSTEREEKIKIARERQNEERLRKIEELKIQAEAAQRYREQKDEERRRRIEEIRSRDSEKRHQVEERKRAIMEADKERREYILKKDYDRESRLETKKRDRNSICFAFGSSTPRLLEPADFGTVSPSTFWGQRRSTSISNVPGASLSRRSSERELNISGSKKRATSAGGTDWHEDDHGDSSNAQIMFRSVARRKTDLMPTIPSPREGHYGSKSSLSFSARTPGRAYSMNRLDQLAQPIRRNGEHICAILNREQRAQRELTEDIESLKNGRGCRRLGSGYRGTKQRGVDAQCAESALTMSRSLNHLAASSLTATQRSRSGNVTPGGSISNSRPGSAMSTSTFAASGNVARRSTPLSRKARPASIAGTGLSLTDTKPPVKALNATFNGNAQTPPKRTSANLLSTSLTASVRLSGSEKKTAAPRQTIHKPVSKTKSTERLTQIDKTMLNNNALNSMSKSDVLGLPKKTTAIDKEPELLPEAIIEPDTLDQADIMKMTSDLQISTSENVATIAKEEKVNGSNASAKIDSTDKDTIQVAVFDKKPLNSTNSEILETSISATSIAMDSSDLMSASMIARNKITTEQEAKAALAERRRKAREEADRLAELERQRLEMEHLENLKQQEKEAEQQRQFEAEALSLAAQQREAEEERLRQAIEDAKLRELEEQNKREEEERLRVEREEIDKKLKEEAEKAKIEVAERLKREEKEREDRRKRVEAIMSRTRKGGTTATNTNSTPVKDNNEVPVQQQQLDPPTSHPYQETTQNNSSTGNSSWIEFQSPDEITPKSLDPSATLQPFTNLAMYEQSVIDKENALINSFSNMVIGENVKNLQQQPQHIHNVILGKQADPTVDSTVSNSVANGNSHIEKITKNEINILHNQTDHSIESQDNTSNYDNNNSLMLPTEPLTPTAALLVADNQEKNDIPSS